MARPNRRRKATSERNFGMSEYIIRNCPCYNNERFLSGFLDDKDTFCTYYSKKCQECTDCVMKQIVEKCKKIIFLNSNVDFVDEDACKQAIGENVVANNILQLLDIRELNK